MLAQTTTPATQQAPALFQAIAQYFPLVLLLLVMYFLLFNNKRKDEKKRQAMIDQLKKGDRVQTIGGILGTVVNADANEITVKVDETSNTKMRFIRSAVHKVITDEKVDAK